MKEQEEKGNWYLDKKVKHIFLSTLVITIIILLVFIVVGVIIIHGNNGQFEIAKNEKKTNEEVENKNEILGEYTNEDEFVDPTITKLLVQTLLGKEASNENQEVQDKNGNILVIPAGFVVVPSGKNNVEYQDPTCPTVEDGIVITDKMEDGEVTGNEFVWIPVEHPEEMYGIISEENGIKHYAGKLYSFSSSENTTKNNWQNVINDVGANKTEEVNGITIDWIQWTDKTKYREPDTVSDYDHYDECLSIVLEGEEKTEEKFKEQLQKEFDDLVASVNKYKGFYIGRYETGALSSENRDSTPKVQKDQTPGNANWYYQYVESKNIASQNDKVTSSMIWGSQWDAVMNWFLKYENSKEYVINSKNKGNYSGARLLTGQYQVKNIYDMAGNVFDWTIEAADNTINRVYRGGLYGFSGSIYPASSRRSAPPGLELYRDAGSRATLIINL